MYFDIKKFLTENKVVLSEAKVLLTKVSKNVVKVEPHPEAAGGGAYQVTHFMNFVKNKMDIKATKVSPGEWIIDLTSHPKLASSWGKKRVGDQWPITI